MRISDWSSDVCSSDLFRIQDERRVVAFVRALVPEVAGLAFTADFKAQAAWSRMRSRHQAGECRAEQGVGLVADGFHRGQAETRQIGCRTPQARGSQFRINRSEEHTSELQSLMRNSYAVLCLTKKKTQTKHTTHDR